MVHNPILNIENCIIYGNTTGSSNPQIVGSGIIGVTNSNIEGGWPGVGNIDENPLFIENSPLILQDGSPCVDKGDSSADNNDWEDPENLGFALPPALGTLRNDMGAYGGNQYKSMPYTSMQITGIEDENGTTPNKYTLNQNYPNPFNPSTNIQFSIPQQSFVILEVYNTLGEKVGVLASEELTTGTYNYTLDASDFTSGIYFYRLQADNFVETKKMILLK